MVDWDELSASERQRMVGHVSVGGLAFEVTDDTDLLVADFIADLSLAGEGLVAHLVRPKDPWL